MENTFEVTTNGYTFTESDNNSETYIIDNDIVSVCYGMISLLAGVGNFTILILFATNRKMLDNNFNVLILNLTIADLAVGVLDLPWQVSLNSHYFIFTYNFRTFSEQFQNFTYKFRTF